MIPKGESHLDPLSAHTSRHRGAIRPRSLTELSLNPGSADYQLCDFTQDMEHLQASFLICKMGMEILPTLQGYLEGKNMPISAKHLAQCWQCGRCPLPFKSGRG